MLRVRKRSAIATLLVVALTGGCAMEVDDGPADATSPEPEALASWNDGAAKQSIVDFVARVTEEGGASFIPPAERVAVFDNDGTLWGEQPAYFQLMYSLDQVKVMASEHPEWATTQPFQAVIEDDFEGLVAQGEEALFQVMGAAHVGMSVSEFSRSVAQWVETSRHPRFERPYTEIVYQPMLEVLDYLRAHGFKTFIVSGGGIDFMRVFAEEVYGIPPEQVVGSSIETVFENADGETTLMRQSEIHFINDKEGKPVGISRFIGRRPIAAFGNSDGDLQMLQYTADGEGESLMVYVHHDDSEREWAYDRESHVGRLDAGLDEAMERGWTVISMKNDWARVFSFE